MKTDDVTITQINALLMEAAQAGDTEQKALCVAALAGDPDAWAECAWVIVDAQTPEPGPTGSATFGDYEIELQDSAIDIYHRHDGIREWAGSGTWNGEQISGCAAVLGEQVYEGLEAALDAAIS